MLFGTLLALTLWLRPIDQLRQAILHGAVAALAEAKKRSKYTTTLDSTLYKFMPIAIETLGAFGARSLQFIKELGRRIKLQSGDPLAKCHLVQRLSVAIQQGNAASILSVT